MLLLAWLGCAHSPKVSSEDASYLHFYACTQTLPVALPSQVKLTPMEGGYDKPSELSPLIAVAHGALWLDGEPQDNVEQLRSSLIDYGSGAAMGLGGPALLPGEPPQSEHVLLAVDGAVTLGELSALFGMLRELERHDWILLGAPATPLPVPEFPDQALGQSLSQQIAAAPERRLAILEQAMEPFTVRCGAMRDALDQGGRVEVDQQCRVVMSSTVDVQELCKQDAASILTLYQLAYGAGLPVTHARLRVQLDGVLVPVSETAVWAQVLPRLAERHGQTVNVAISAQR